VDGIKLSLNEQMKLSRRVARGLACDKPNRLVAEAAYLTKAWNESVTTPLPDKLLELGNALEAKLAALDGLGPTADGTSLV
jgi:hypothetical protein